MGQHYSLPPFASPLLLINGAPLPVITLPTAQWQRWRILYAAMQDFVLLGFVPPEACEMWLLATDGNYLAAAPRKVPNILLASGNRMDVVVRCTAHANLVSNATEQVPLHSSMLVGKVATVRVGDGGRADTDADSDTAAAEAVGGARRLLSWSGLSDWEWNREGDSWVE